MTEVIGDLLIPRELILPVMSGTASQQPVKAGAIFLSGATMTSGSLSGGNLTFYDGTSYKQIVLA